MSIPETGYRTAIAIKHDARMVEVNVTFRVREHNGDSATYAGLCPRCNSGEIVVAVKLNSDGGIAEEPACPMLCLDCEDALDSMLEAGAATQRRNEPADRATLGRYLRAMNTRAWD